MAPTAIDYGAVLRDLEQKRAESNARFDAAIAAIRQIMTLQQSPAKPSLLDLAHLSDQRHGGQRGTLSMVDMAIQHLGSVGRPVTNMELARALDAAGFPHQSKNFPNTLNSVLHRRAKNVGDVRKVGNAWALTSFS